MRRFIPGSSWVYLKIYSGPIFLEDLLSKVIYPQVIIYYENQIINEFFFVRYTSEDGYHLRLRFHLVDEKSFGSLINDLHLSFQPFVQNRVIYKVAIDTYVREVERYREVPIEYAETIFGYNSIQILHLLDSENNYEDILLKGISIGDQTLSILGVSNLDKFKVYESYYRAYSKELGFNYKVPTQLKSRNRELSKKLIYFLDEEKAPPPIYGKEVILQVQRCKEEVIKGYQLTKRDSHTESYYQLLKDILHLHYNRLFRVNQRTHEFVIYFMLCNFYKSKLIKADPSLKLNIT